MLNAARNVLLGFRQMSKLAERSMLSPLRMQAGARSVSQPPTPTGRAEPVMQK
jgi:hypothetical protein